MNNILVSFLDKLKKKDVFNTGYREQGQFEHHHENLAIDFVGK
jgi:hypothetical protein